MRRGDMIETDARTAALMLVTPLLVASLHQDQLNGSVLRPLSTDQLARDLSGAFVRAYGASTH